VKALLIGTGSKWGEYFTNLLANTHNYNIDLITSSDYPSTENVTCHKVNWYSLDLPMVQSIIPSLRIDPYDIVFFNQNTGGPFGESGFRRGTMTGLADFNQHLFVNCYLPYILIKELTDYITPNTKICWMLTGLIDGKDPDLWQYSGYGAVKSFNVHMLKGFANSHPGIFTGINPFWFPEGQEQNDAELIYNLIQSLTAESNGRMYFKDKREWELSS